MKTIYTFLLLFLPFVLYSQVQFEELEKKYNFQAVLNIQGFPGDNYIIAPKYIGGKAGLDKFIVENIIYPEKAKKENIQGTVILMYVINTSGEIAETQVLSDTPDLLNNELIRVLLKSHPWIPGKKNGKYIRMKLEISYEFKLN